MPPEANLPSGSSKDDADDKGSDGGGSFDAFLTYLSDEGPPPPPIDAANIEDGVVGGIGLDDAPDDSDTSLTKKAEGGHSATATPSNSPYPPSFFTNDRGNLKAVAFVVRRPCLVFNLLVSFCILLSFLLQVLVFRAAENGVPFTPPANEFDLNDVRSVQFDSYRLAKDEVQASRKANEDGDKVTPRQSEVAAIAMWVFEAEEMGDDDPDNDYSGRGVFGSAESIRDMKEAYDIFITDPAFKTQCLLDYRVWPGAAIDTSANSTDEKECLPPLTPLAMYYASEWDSDMVSHVIDELKDPEKMEIFNSLALCFTRGQYCEQVIDDVAPEDAVWAMELGANITSITSKFDMKGEMVKDFDQVTELASYLIQVDVFKGFVDFGFDLGFSAENPVSR
jgi:hypothetical protein